MLCYQCGLPQLQLIDTALPSDIFPWLANLTRNYIISSPCSSTDTKVVGMFKMRNLSFLISISFPICGLSSQLRELNTNLDVLLHRLVEAKLCLYILGQYYSLYRKSTSSMIFFIRLNLFIFWKQRDLNLICQIPI